MARAKVIHVAFSHLRVKLVALIQYMQIQMLNQTKPQWYIPFYSLHSLYSTRLEVGSSEYNQRKKVIIELPLMKLPTLPIVHNQRIFNKASINVHKRKSKAKQMLKEELNMIVT